MVKSRDWEPGPVHPVCICPRELASLLGPGFRDTPGREHGQTCYFYAPWLSVEYADPRAIRSLVYGFWRNGRVPPSLREGPKSPITALEARALFEHDLEADKRPSRSAEDARDVSSLLDLAQEAHGHLLKLQGRGVLRLDAKSFVGAENAIADLIDRLRQIESLYRGADR